MARGKAETWWCVESYGRLLPWSTASMRRDALKAYTEVHIGPGEVVEAARARVAKLRRHGEVRVIKITVRRA